MERVGPSEARQEAAVVPAIQQEGAAREDVHRSEEREHDACTTTVEEGGDISGERQQPTDCWVVGSSVAATRPDEGSPGHCRTREVLEPAEDVSGLEADHLVE